MTPRRAAASTLALSLGLALAVPAHAQSSTPQWGDWAKAPAQAQPAAPKAPAAAAKAPADAPVVKDPREEYERSYVAFQDYALVHVGSGRQVGQGAVATQGKFKKPLEGADFYRAVGREDLAARYAQTNTLRWAMMVGGGVIGVAAPVTAFMLMDRIHDPADPGPFSQSYPQYDPLFCYSQPDPQACIAQYNREHDQQVADWEAARDANLAAQQQHTRDLAAVERQRAGYLPLMLGGLALGAGVAVVGALLNPDPVDLPGRRELADVHNRALRQKLGVPEPRAEQPVLQDVRLSAGVGPQGGALVLSGRF